MANNTYLYFVSGLFTAPDSAGTWTKLATKWMREHGYCDLPGSYDYFAAVFGGLLRDDEAAAIIAKDFIDAIAADKKITAVGHSNGCRILMHTLKLFPKLRIENLHLIAAWDDADCNANGLNEAVARGQLGKVIFYVSAVDNILANGKLGKAGPHAMSDMLKAITGIVSEPMMHSEWVHEKFEWMMAQIVAA